MLNPERQATTSPEAAAGYAQPLQGLNPFDLIAVFRRQLHLIVLTFGLVVGLSIVYTLTAAPVYTSTTTVLIDSQRNRDQSDAAIAELRLDSGAIDSQVEIIQSDSVALNVVKTLNLEADPSFRESWGLWGQVFSLARSVFDIKSWFISTSLTEAEQAQAAERKIVVNLKRNLVVRRVARTYVISISFTHPNPGKASRVANAFADAYFADQLSARYDITKRASGWLHDRIAELRDNSIRSDLAVQKFKADNGLISTLGAQGTNVYLSDQQLAEASAQLSLARAETSKAEARVQLLDDILRDGNMDAAVTETLGSVVINEIRGKYLKASKTAVELAVRVGQSHFQVVSLRNEMAEYRRLMFEELQRIGQTYRAELEISRSKEKSMSETVGTLIGSQTSSNRTMVELRNLEREAETFKSLYQTFLQRYQDAIQRQSFPSTEARVITPAVASTQPSAPNSGLILVLASVAGLALGCGLAWMQEARSSVFRDPQQVREVLGVPCIGLVAMLDKGNAADLPPHDNPRHIKPTDMVMGRSVDEPLSGLAEAIRAARLEIEIALKDTKGGKVIGVASLLPGEGKTTLAKNFASLIAFLGSKVVLVDADLRNPGLTRRLAGHATAGLLEVLSGEQPISDVLLSEPNSQLGIIPAVVKRRPWQSADLLASKDMERVLQELRSQYDYVVLDLPPIAPVIDVRAVEHMLDGILLVVEWGRTSRELLRRALTEDKALYDRCVGVLLNKVKVEQLTTYGGYGSKGYYYRSYQSYLSDHDRQAKA